jgi:hypothetical protein
VGVIVVLVVYLIPVVLLVAVVVWGVNLSTAVFSIEAILKRMEARQQESALPAPAASAPIDMKPSAD